MLWICTDVCGCSVTGLGVGASSRRAPPDGARGAEAGLRAALVVAGGWRLLLVAGPLPLQRRLLTDAASGHV